MATQNNNTFDPTSIGAIPVNNGFDPTSIGAIPSQSTATDTNQSTGGGFLDTLGNIGAGTVNLINNNPISRGINSLAALPVQGLAKAMGKPDPFAGGIGGSSLGAFAPVGVTSSDQPLGDFAKETAGNALQVGALFLPVGEAADLAGTGLARFAPKLLQGAAGLVGRVGVNAAAGSLYGLAGGLQDKQSGSDLVGSAKTGALIAAPLAIAGELGSALLSSFKATGESRLLAQKNNLKTLMNVFNNTSTPTTNPIQTMEQNGLTQGLRVIDGKVNVEGVTNPNGSGILDNLIEKVKEMGTQAVHAMSDKGSVLLADFKKAITNAVENNPYLKAEGNIPKILSAIDSKFNSYAQSYGDNLSYEQIDDIRKAMNRKWNPELWDAEKAIGTGARSILYDGSGAGTALQSAMQSEQELLNAQEFIQKLNDTAVKGGKLGKYILDAMGMSIGAGIGAPIPIVGPIAGAAIGGKLTDMGVNLAQKNYFDPLLSKPANTLSRWISSPLGEGARQTGKQVLISNSVKK